MQWLHFKMKGRRHSFPFDNQREVLMMIKLQELREQIKEGLIADEKSLRGVQRQKNG